MAVSEAREEVAHVLIDYGFSVDSRNFEGQAPIHIAARDSLVPMVKLLIECGADITATNNKHETALNIAVMMGDVEACKAILESSPDRIDDFINLGDKNADTPLYHACLRVNSEISRLLLEEKADANQKCSDGWTPLHVAASQIKGNDIVKLLLNNRADHSVRNDYQSTPIFLAAEKGSTNIVRLLLENSADPKVISSTGSSALHRAAQNGHIDCVEILVDAGGNYNLPKRNGYTPLHCAIAGSHNDVVEYLVRKGADVNATGDSKLSALELAMLRKNFVAANVLIGARATMTLDETYMSGWFEESFLIFAIEHPAAFTIPSSAVVLQLAISRGYDQAALMLIGSGMDLNEQGGLYCTALQAAACTGSLGILEELLARGAKHDIVGGKYGTALNAAVSVENLEVVKLLLKEHANPEEKDFCERTPLMNAVMANEFDLVKVLLEKGANPDASDSEMKTPLIRSVINQWYSHDHRITEILLQHNADPRLKDCRGRGPLYWACLKGSRRLAIDTIVPALRAKDDLSLQSQLAFHAATSMISGSSTDNQQDSWMTFYEL